MDTSGQGQRDETRAGVGTISRQAARPAAGARLRPEAAPVPVPVPAADPAARRARRRRPEAVPRPRNARPAPSADPAPGRARRLPQETVPRPGSVLPAAPAPQRNARPAPSMPPATQAPSQAVPQQAVPQQATSPQARPRAVASPGATHRMPFVLMLCALLGGALVCALVISTTLAEGSFQITGLQQSTNALARQRQALEEQVAQAQSAQVIENRALTLGMRPEGQLRYVDLKTGKTSSDQGNSVENAIKVPGYTP
jgi:hypothetical protein